MVDVPKQIEYWTTGSEEDFAAAQSLFEKGHLRHSLFFAALIYSSLKDVIPIQSMQLSIRIWPGRGLI